MAENFLLTISSQAYQLACTQQGVEGAKQHLAKVYNNPNPSYEALALGLVEYCCVSVCDQSMVGDGMNLKQMSKEEKELFRKAVNAATNAAAKYTKGANFGDYQRTNNANTAKGAAAGGIIGALLGGNWLGVGLSAVAGGLLGSSNKQKPDSNIFYSYVKNGIIAWFQTFGAVLNKAFAEEERLQKEKMKAIAYPKLNDVIGLEKAKEMITEKIIEPSLDPELYKKYKMEIGGGLLLYGLPGTGKTMFAKAVANEINAEFYSVKASDLKSKYHGESEEKIRDLFNKARKDKVAIIFIDELEALAGSRDKNNLTSTEVVPELLAQMDGFEKNKNTLLIIGATNRPWDIDSGILRRLKTQVYVELPNEESRKSIIQGNLTDINISKDLIEYLAEGTDNYNGSDLKEVCETIKHLVIKKEKRGAKNYKITKEDCEKILDSVHSTVSKSDKIRMDKFGNARPTGGNVKKAKDKDKLYPLFKDVIGLDEAKEFINDRVIEPARHPEIYKKHGMKVGGGLLLYGLPGTGKTMFAKAVANEIKGAFYSVKASDIKSKWMGESEGNIKNLFEQAREEKVAVIFIDEFEAIGGKRTSSENDPTSKIIIPELLAQMQGFEDSDNILLVIAATNRPWDIDSALKRPGRFDSEVCVDLPNEECRKEMFKAYLSKENVSPKNISYLAKNTEGYNGSDVKNVSDELARLAVKKEVSGVENYSITQKDCESVLKKVKSSVKKADIAMINRYMEE